MKIAENRFRFCIFKRIVTGKVIALNIEVTHEGWRLSSLMGKALSLPSLPLTH